MIKFLYIALFGIVVLHFASCNREIGVSAPEIVPIDTVGVVTGDEYFLQLTIGDTTMNFRTRHKNVANGVFQTLIAPCFVSSGFDSVKYTSYFSYVADTNRNEIVGFGLINCVPKDANGYRDSTYVIGRYPMENSYMDTIPVDTARGFIDYVDADSVYWSSSLTQNGYGAQVGHEFEITSLKTLKNIDSQLEARGSFSGWVYNADGDSLLVKNAKFFSKCWGY